MAAVAGSAVRPAAAPDHTGRSVAAWLAGLGLSLGADEMFFLALAWAAIQVGSPGQVGLVVAAGALPRVAIMLIGGALADRGRPRRVAAISGTTRALALLAAAAVASLADLQIWALVVVALVVGALDGLFSPAMGSLPGQFAADHEMGRIAALRVVTQRLVLTAAAPVTGALIVVAGSAGAFWVAGGLFLAAVACLALVSLSRPRAADASPSADGDAPRESGGFLREVRSGLGLVRRHPVLPWLLLLVAALNLGFTGPVNAGLPLLSAQEGWGAGRAGVLLGGLGLGAAISGLTLFFARWVPRAGYVILAAAAVEGLALLAFGLAGSFAATLAAGFVLGLGSGVMGGVVHALLLTIAPSEHLGKVMALLGLTLEGTFPISNAIFGFLAESFDVRVGFVVGGAVLLAGTAFVATRGPVRAVEMVRTPRAAGRRDVARRVRAD